MWPQALPMHHDLLMDDIPWVRCPECLAVLQPVERGDMTSLGCDECGYLSDDWVVIPALQPTSPADLPSFKGF